ncbi:glycosyltransferase family 25 protein [Veillonella montpellierensis]|uniref:glycosyltransferase family 25 protein n=1 Tax=Veillonella montpellierensis TaxID=187328 RepID=UPI0023F9CE3D|nr:glycosyltransferase family 25 protein [Veillonella montpellierensis]
MYHYFIVNVDDKKRMANVQREAEKIQLTPHIFPAIMAKTMSKEELERATIPNTYLVPGEIGCALSHLAIYKEFLATDKQSVLIFEDDVTFTPDCSLKALQACREFVESLARPSVLLLSPVNTYYKKVHQIDSISIYSSFQGFGAYAYILNREAAKNILQYQTPICHVIDHFKYYYYLGICDVYFTDPSLAISHTEWESTIDTVENSRYNKEGREQQEKDAFKNILQQAPISQKIYYLTHRLYKHIFGKYGFHKRCK